jgi:elongation factor P hydroxylase
VTSAAALEAVFHDCFLAAFNTRLCGGASEPLYRPARAGELATIHYREDFAASALHEVAHWCIAGPRRRELEDFGYWYLPDGRNPGQQAAFERVEVRPQALEWHFSLAARLPFRVSIDNLAESSPTAAGFQRAVAEQARRFCSEQLPPRGEQFRLALAAALGGLGAPSPELFQ